MSNEYTVWFQEVGKEGRKEQKKYVVWLDQIGR